jgi:uncharacterized protein (TIRG00374 family)
MKLRHFVFFVALVLLGLLFLRNAGQLQQFIALMKELNIWVLLLVLPVRFGYYWANTRFYDHFFSGLYKKRIPFWRLFEGVVSMNFVNTVVPTGGVSGAAYFAQIFRSKISQKQSFIAQFFWYIATFLSLVVVLAISFLVLFFSQSIIQVSYRLILIVVSLLLFVAFCVIAMTLNPHLFERVLFYATRPINWVLKLLRKGKIGERQTTQFVDGYRTLIELFAKDPRRALRPLSDALLCIMFEVLSIFIVFLAFGQVVNPGMVGAAYVFALLMSSLSFFTSGVGMYEATMVAVEVALGVPFGLAFSVTTIYRLMALWLFIPVGLWFYKRQVLDDEEKTSV